MNSYTDKDMNKLAVISMLGFSIALAMLIVLIPTLEKNKEEINQIENRIKTLENTCQKS